MANIKSQIKRNRQNEKRRVRNMKVRSKLKTLEKAAVAAAGTDGEAEAIAAATSVIDKASVKNVIHSNAAARRKSRLMKRVAEASK